MIIFLLLSSSFISVSKPVEKIEEQLQITNDGLMDSPWPMKCHDTHHTGRSEYSTEENIGFEKWRFKTESWVESSSAISDEGTIYVTDLGGYIYALYPNSSLIWKNHLWGWLTSPAIDETGTIYVGSDTNKLFALNPNGTIKWIFTAVDPIFSSPAIGDDGTIYFGITGPGWDKGRVYAVAQNGTEKWHYDTGYWIVSDPAIGDDGTIYIGSGDTYLYALYPNGTLRWRFKTGDYIKGPPSIADDGTIYIGSLDDYLYALYPNGTMKWKFDVGPGTRTNPSIGSDGTVYIGSDKLYAINQNGTQKWFYDPGDRRFITRSCPCISEDGTIYVGTGIDVSDGGELIAINFDGTEKWRSGLIGNLWVESSPIIGEDGTVYIGSSSDIMIDPPRVDDVGYLHAFKTIDPNAPEEPSIIGETDGKSGQEYEYTFSSSDPNGDDIYYHIEWGDGKIEESIGPYESGEEVIVSHIWEEQGTYTIRARANDTNNLLSPWGELVVTMPVNQQQGNSLFIRFLERFPNAFPMLRNILGL